jgi:2-haloacid dehalogenase
MVAAHPSDLRAAAGRGFQTAYVHRPDEFGAERVRAWPPDDFTFKATSFLDLADQLRA